MLKRRPRTTTASADRGTAALRQLRPNPAQCPARPHTRTRAPARTRKPAVCMAPLGRQCARTLPHLHARALELERGRQAVMAGKRCRGAAHEGGSQQQLFRRKQRQQPPQPLHPLPLPPPLHYPSLILRKYDFLSFPPFVPSPLGFCPSSPSPIAAHRQEGDQLRGVGGRMRCCCRCLLLHVRHLLPLRHILCAAAQHRCQRRGSDSSR